MPTPLRGPVRHIRLGTHPLWQVKTGHPQARLLGVRPGCLLVLAGDKRDRAHASQEDL